VVKSVYKAVKINSRGRTRIPPMAGVVNSHHKRKFCSTNKKLPEQVKR